MTNEIESTIDVNGRDEEASLYVALLERQVMGLTLINLRQKATIEFANLDDEFDLAGAVEETAKKIISLQEESKKGFRRSSLNRML